MTAAVNTGLVRETLGSATGRLLVTGAVREVLRTTGAGGATRAYVSGAVREILWVPQRAQPIVMVLA